MDALNPEQASRYMDMAVGYAMDWGPKLLLALLVLWIGLWLANRVAAGVGKAMEAKADDDTLPRFMTSLIGITLKVLVVISAASMVGIATTSFIAIIGAAGLAVGLALQGSLANFAGGVLILIFKPFKVGDFIDGQGVSGTVNAISILNTILLTPDNKRIVVPNGPLSNDVITNYSAEDRRRVDMVFGIGYDDDIDLAKRTLAELIDADSRVQNEPAPQILLSELADSSVNFTVRMWVERADYWGVYFDLMENVKKTFDAKGISIPYPQTDVHLHQVANG